ncbi:MAG: RimK family alpha-L-glutamate ligase [Anaerolineae bacterium]
MKIGILSRNRGLYSTRRLAQAARLRGHGVEIIDTMAVAVEVGVSEPPDSPVKVIAPQVSVAAIPGLRERRVTYLPHVDAIIPRIGASVTYYGMAVVRQFEARDVLTTAASQAIGRSRDKLHSMQLMSQAGLPIPKTAVIAGAQALYPAIQAVGGPPVVIKLIQGTQGRGVFLARNLSTAAAVLEKLKQLKKQALLQEYVAEAGGKDTRIIVVGDRCVAAMIRQAAAGEFRSNLHRGGTAVPATLDKETEHLAVAAAKAHGLNVAGVDVIQSKRGPLLLEVNSSPGLKGIEGVTKVDVAREIIRFLEHAWSKQNRRHAGHRRRSWS